MNDADWAAIRLGLDAEDPNLLLGQKLFERAQDDYDLACERLMDTDFETDPDTARALRFQGSVAKAVLRYLTEFIEAGRLAQHNVRQDDLSPD